MDIYSEYDPSIEFLFMGWCYRLYKISKDHNLSLKHSFDKYLSKSIGNFNYHGILNNKKYLMDSNIAIMNMFYLLFHQICKTINIYETPNVQQHQYISDVTQCYIMYSKLYELANHCGPYLRLFNHLKTTYDDFIKAVIKDNNYDQSLRNRLIELSSINKSKFGSEFNSKGCNRVHQILEKKISRLKNKAQEEHDEQDELNTLMELLVSDDDEDADGDDAGNDNGGDSEKKFDIIKNIDNASKNHEKDTGKLSDQSNESKDDSNQSQCNMRNNTDNSNGKALCLGNGIGTSLENQKSGEWAIGP